MQIQSVVIKLLALALAAMVALCVAIVAGVLTRLTGVPVAQAVLDGGTAFGGTLALALAVLTTLKIL
ncbi:hypothetical protein [Frankia sp. R82]|uniref:hypothetical protein n=1 Tax=Frankia sp. R82 TaxID=2950553 RepID=UPI0020436CFE|nr:hypothetical protein [Frankia sp. R82]MCM3886658.1 hypothetical protein [Frankia sp. R82]